MRFSPYLTKVANETRLEIQLKTNTVSEGEGVAILTWYTFIMDHAREKGLDPKALAQEQLGHFIDKVVPGISLVNHDLGKKFN